MASDFLSEIQAQRIRTPPKPVKKPFTPDVAPGSPEARNYESYYNVDPHEFGNRIKQSIVEAQKQGLPYGETSHRPMATLGAQGFDPTRVLPLPGNLEGIGGAYFPESDRLSPSQSRVTYDTRSILGENQRLIEDFIMTTPKGGKPTVKHELTHRAFRHLEKTMAETKGRMPPRFSLNKEVKFWNEDDFRTRSVKLNEEDVVKLLDYVSGDKKELVENYFGNGKERGYSGKWKNVLTSPEELLESQDVFKLLMTIQQFAAEELKKQGINVPIHFGNLNKNKE